MGAKYLQSPNFLIETHSGKFKWEVKTKDSSNYKDYSNDCVEGNPEITLAVEKSITLTCTSQKIPNATTGPHTAKVTWLVSGLWSSIGLDYDPQVEFVYGDLTPPILYFDTINIDGDTVSVTASAEDTETDIDANSCQISWNGGQTWYSAKQTNIKDISTVVAFKYKFEWNYPDGTHEIKYRCNNKAGLSGELSDVITIKSYPVSDYSPLGKISLGDDKGQISLTDDDGYVWAKIENVYANNKITVSYCEVLWDDGTNWEKLYIQKRNFIIYAPHRYTTMGTKNVELKCTSINGDSTTYSDHIEIASTTSPEPNLKLLFVPLKWSGSQDEFDTTADSALNFFLEEVPLKNCKEKVSIKKMDVKTESFDSFNCLFGSLSAIRDFVNKKGYNPGDYDIIVGLIKENDNACIFFGTVGASNGEDIFYITVGEYSNIIFSHEIGHIFGLEDQYCSNPAGSIDIRCNDGGNSKYFYKNIPDKNPLSTSLSCDPDGKPCCNFDNSLCSEKDYGVCCQGNKNSLGGRSIMSYADAEGPRAFDQKEIEYLSKIPQLQC